MSVKGSDKKPAPKGSIYPGDHTERLKTLEGAMGQKLRQVFDEAKAALVMHEPFFSSLLFDLVKLVPSWDLPTAATDGHTVWINPEFFAEHTPAQRVFILAHEICHVMWMHCQRMKMHRDTGGFIGPHSGKQRRWSNEFYNVCADLMINDMLKESRTGHFKEGWLLSPDVKGGEQVELVYDRLYKESNDGSGYPTSGGTGNVSGKSFDEHLPPDPTQPPPDAEDVKEAVATAAQAAKAQGKLPAGMERFVKELLEPQVDWRTKLRHFINRAAGDDDRSYARPNRRRLAMVTPSGERVVMPGLVGHSAGRIMFVGDTSGSIGEKEMTAFMTEACAIVQDLQPELFSVMWCDATVHSVDHFEEGATPEDVMSSKPKGGGGTDFRPVFDWIEKNDYQPATVVFCTDLYGSFPKEKPPYAVIWVATTDETPPFGETVRITL